MCRGSKNCDLVITSFCRGRYSRKSWRWSHGCDLYVRKSRSMAGSRTQRRLARRAKRIETLQLMIEALVRVEQLRAHNADEHGALSYYSGSFPDRFAEGYGRVSGLIRTAVVNLKGYLPPLG